MEKVIERLSLIEPRNPGCKAQIEEVYLTPLRVSELHVNIADSFSQEHHEKLLPYNDMVEETVDLQELANHNYVLLPTLENELGRIKDELIQIRNQLDEEHLRVGAELGVDTEKKLHLENHQVHRYSLRITKAVCTESVPVV